MFKNDIQILIADDMKTMRKIVMRSLSELGYKNITEAEDGEKAWSLLVSGASKFDLIISDWNMPNLTGLDLLKRVRSDEKFKPTPFLLLTAESEPSQVTQAISAGVDNYLVKPFATAQLEAKLKEVCKKRGIVKAAA